MLALSYGHWRHADGASAFRRARATVFGHAAAEAHIRRRLPAYSQAVGESEYDLSADLAWPHVAFSRELHLDLEGRRVDLLPTPGHTGDSACAYAPH